MVVKMDKFPLSDIKFSKYTGGSFYTKKEVDGLIAAALAVKQEPIEQ